MSPQPTSSSSPRRRVSLRTFYVTTAAVCVVLLITLLSFILKDGSPSALLLLDKGGQASIFTYPFTIQNLLYVLFAMGLGDAVYRRMVAAHEHEALSEHFLPEDAESVLLRKDLPSLRFAVLEAKRDTPYGFQPAFLTRAIDECILYFHANDSVDKTQSFMATLTGMELHKVDLNYTMLRYFTWVLPTVGFIGTVSGIAGALKHLPAVIGAEDAVAAMDPVLLSLGLAFNTTIVALVLNALLMLVLQRTQRMEEAAINEGAEYCLRNMINRLFTPPVD